MFKLKSFNNIYNEVANSVSFAESDVRWLQGRIDYNLFRLADLQGENGEEIAARRRRAMRGNGACDFHDESGRPAYLTADDLRREAESEISRLEKKLSSAKKVLAERQAELERVRLFLVEEEARIFPPVVEEEDDEDDLVF